MNLDSCFGPGLMGTDAVLVPMLLQVLGTFANTMSYSH